MTKSLPIGKRMVWDSYQKVVAKGGGAGIDRESIGMFNANMADNLYKLWNRGYYGLNRARQNGLRVPGKTV